MFLLRGVSWFVFIACFSFAWGQAAGPVDEQRSHSVGRILFNDDGDYTYVGNSPDEWRVHLAQMLEGLNRIPVTGLVYSLATGTDVLLYPSQAGSSWGWKQTEIPSRLSHIRQFPIAVQSGYDGVRWAAEDAMSLGLAFVPAFRMNDAHYTSGNASYLEGRFWEENRGLYTFQQPPYPVGKLNGYKELLDFSHQEVRAHRLAVIEEAISRYTDVLDGFLLDFMRTPAFFDLDMAEDKAPLMTELVLRVRQALDCVEAEKAQRIPLIVRVPATLNNCRRVGLDLPEWMRQGIVQIVIPAQAMTLAHDSPLQEFIDLGEPQGILVYASIYERTNYTCSFSRQAPDKSDFIGRSASAQLLRGAINNYRHMGAAGFELYNFNLPLNEAQGKAFQSLDSSDSDAGLARVYAITPAYFFDYLDIYEPAKQIPFPLSKAKPALRLNLYFGENPAGLNASDYCGLRLGFARDIQPDALRVSLNGNILEASSSSSLNVKQGPRAFLQYAIPDASDVLREGGNDLLITVTDAESTVENTLVEVQVGILSEGS